MKEKFLALSSAFAAFAASLCCLGPLVLGSVGLGAAMVAMFAPLRPYFLALSGLLLALGFFYVYRKPKTAQACEGEVCAVDTRARRLAKPILWVATLAVLALAFFPLYGGKLIGAATVPKPMANVGLQTVELEILGMSCEACAGVVKQKLLETPGVADAVVDYPGGRAAVKYDPTRIDPANLIAAIRTTGYQASLRKSTGE